MKTESQEAAVMSMLSRLFAAADGASGKRFDEAFRVRVVAAPAASGHEEGGERERRLFKRETAGNLK